MLSDKWNKRDSRTFDATLAEFAVDFCYDTNRLSTWDDFQEFWDYFAEGCEVTILKLSDDYSYYANFDGDKTYYLVDDDKLHEMCMERIPEVEFKKWLKKNGYCLDQKKEEK